MSLLECNNLSVGYNGKVVASNINFKIEKGDYLVIIGENGSGKSTLVKTILRLIKPISGQIKFSDEIGKNEIGYLPQQTSLQKSFPASVYEIILSGCQNKLGWRPFYPRYLKQRVIENVKLLGIEHLLKKSYKELSGGQQQKVLLARSLCAAEKMILLDEPVTGLDPDAQKEMYKLLERLNIQYGMTIIMISHDIENVEKYASHILKFGEKVEFSECQNYFQH
ncbi:MAG: ABC transporter ATP-binding protein [Treponemataceae bacterium]|nr:ABC transporter ATP-binding protein [Treponemataceae bacterium]